MNRVTLALALAWSVTLCARADEARYETTATTNGVLDISIEDYETGQIVYLDDHKDGITYKVIKSGQELYNLKGSPTEGTIIRGSAIFRTIATPPPPPAGANYSAMTVKIMPVSFPPNQTLIIPPGTNQVQVSLETSTNLVNWTTTTNGIFGSPECARFFRIKMTKL